MNLHTWSWPWLSLSLVGMVLRCQRCERAIEPEEPMITVEVDSPSEWAKPARVAARLQYAATRWHYRCAPALLRRYASPVTPGPLDRG